MKLCVILLAFISVLFCIVLGLGVLQEPPPEWKEWPLGEEKQWGAYLHSWEVDLEDGDTIIITGIYQETGSGLDSAYQSEVRERVSVGSSRHRTGGPSCGETIVVRIEIRVVQDADRI
ncbi:MAG: hypothetical protein U9Q67_00815, partial [Patescibacteria group bacterium]|nr:hypothetical protein [Patescibacteria group bacterium]